MEPPGWTALEKSKLEERFKVSQPRWRWFGFWRKDVGDGAATDQRNSICLIGPSRHTVSVTVCRNFALHLLRPSCAKAAGKV